MPADVFDDNYWMQRAIVCAKQAAQLGEVPVGAVIVVDGLCVAESWNQSISSRDPSAHAEISAIRQACRNLDNYRIPGATLYVTLEPCVMCVGAIVHARVSRVVYGALEPKAGAIESQCSMLDNHPFNWKVETQGGLLAEECAAILSGFFQQRRAEKKQK